MIYNHPRFVFIVYHSCLIYFSMIRNRSKSMSSSYVTTTCKGINAFAFVFVRKARLFHEIEEDFGLGDASIPTHQKLFHLSLSLSLSLGLCL